MSDIAAQVPAICDMMAEGKSLREVCRQKGLNEASVRYWLNKTEEAFTQTARARELGCDALADECIEIADNKELDPADRRVRIETRLKLIGKWSQRYSDKLTVNNTTTVTHKYDLDRLSDERLDELERLLADAARDKGGEGETVTPRVH
jgi:hypothetical protein